MPSILDQILEHQTRTVPPPPPPVGFASDVLAEILAKTGTTLEQLREEAEAPLEGEARRVVEVQDTVELRRVISLPRRTWTPEQMAEVASGLTDALKHPWGQQALRPIQGAALHDIHQLGGAFLSIRVGGGKTLISYLAPSILDARRPLLVIPAKLKSKTRREFRTLAAHWNGPHPDAFRIESYELLGRMQAADVLQRYQPDLIILDEAQKLKNAGTAVAKRVRRYVEAFPGTVVVAMSGTMTKRSLRDFANLLRWCLPRCCPVPTVWKDLDAWSNAIDEKVQPSRRVRPGALVQLCNAEEAEIIRREGSGPGPGGVAALFETESPEVMGAVRRAFRRRLVETPGVVATQENDLGVSLSITALEPPKLDPVIESHFVTLRTDWETPDGHPVIDGIALWRTARQLGLGGYYRWNPRPPDWWLDPRKAWAKFCREILKYNRRGLDSEAQVVRAVEAGHYKDFGLLDHWRAVKDQFTPTTEWVWLSTEALDVAQKWTEENKGIVWVEALEFGKELARRTGLAFYHAGGLDDAGRFIEDHPHGTSLIASIASNYEGRNLQYGWSESAFFPLPTSGDWCEQALGRTHRDGQESDVGAAIYLGCWEHLAGYYQARRDAQYSQDVGGQPQKLLYADTDIPAPEVFVARGGMRWVK